MEEFNIIPKLRLFQKVKNDKGKMEMRSTGEHKVKLIADKETDGTDYNTGQPKKLIRYLVEENGEKRIYETNKLNKSGELAYLVRRLGEINENTEVILCGQRRGMKNFVDVRVIGEAQSVELEDEEEEINLKEGEMEEE